jgi:hypothetical protein
MSRCALWPSKLLTRLVLGPLLLRPLFLLGGRLIGLELCEEHGEYDTEAGSRIPKMRSREYLSGSRIMRAVETAMLRRGSSAPPSVTQMGLPQWAFLVAIDMDAMTPSGPKGFSSPKAVSTPPPNSESPAR